MKTLIRKINLITVVLTLFNIGLGVVLFYQNIPLIIITAIFSIIELIVLLLYLLISTYQRLNVQLKKNDEQQDKVIQFLENKLGSIEMSIEEQTTNSKGQLEELSGMKSQLFLLEKSIEKQTLSDEIQLNNLQLLIEKTTFLEALVGTSKTEIKTSMERGFTSTVVTLDTTDKKNILVINELTNRIASLQKNLIAQLDEKTNNLLINQQGFNKKLEVTQQQTIDLSSDILGLVDKKATNINYNLDKKLNITYDRIDALMSIHNLVSLNAPLPIMHDWRVSSDFAHAILTNLLEKKEGSVIDIGSGISTLLLGYGVKKNGTGKVISLEHDKAYYEKSKALIKAHQLEDYCELYYCPLIEYTIAEDKWMWYDFEKISFPKDVILISVDGPPGNTQKLARYPVVPLLKEFITKNTVIMLDDGDRDDEKEIASKWSEEFKLNQTKVASHKGYFELEMYQP